jgi:hypothetical protein
VGCVGIDKEYVHHHIDLSKKTYLKKESLCGEISVLVSGDCVNNRDTPFQPSQDKNNETGVIRIRIFRTEFPSHHFPINQSPSLIYSS